MEHYAFPALLYRMKDIHRWSLMRNTQQESVALHSYYVAVWTHLLCTIGNVVYGKSLPVEQIASRALFHDATEVFVGDVAQPVKHSNPGILQHFRDIERAAAERMADMLPDGLQEVYRPLISPDKGSYDHYVKAADLLDAYLKCVSELSAGNQEFKVAKQQIEDQLKRLELEEVDYFLQQMAPAFEKTIDELSI
ncbi:5'-deoxynucleotidase [Xylanibacillus composti]|uniref:5'-deoxynucleotidase n=1 Tax=Xylanibacillus composti TaxID=1572762 RepID=A0A8J4M3B7_9BACL|nr:5'-deoxynucleotidase [Xylanibacillus composti]MDT9724800.1 5'-deoxynucleotidase [Xylanibacillus composti]GIQ69847.1 hypothetical protein XYCOK13_26710 [Xylanibacillus composti]